MRTLPLAELMSQSVITVPPESMISEALAVMSDNRISCLVVVDQGTPVGILTERDLVKHCSKISTSAPQKVSAIMTPSPTTVDAGMDQFTAFKLMKAGHFRHLVVTDAKGDVAGVVTETDFVRHLGVDFYLRPKDVFSAMAPAVTVDENCPLDQAITRLAKRGTFCIIVTKGGQATGILTERDIVHLLQSENDMQGSVGDVASTPLKSIAAEASLLDASELLRSNSIRHLAVVDGDGNAIGIIGEHEIVKGLESEYVVHLEEIIAEKNAALADLSRAHLTLEQQSCALKKAVDDLMFSHDELREMAHIAAHDLQEPTRVIISFAQLLNRHHSDKLDDELKELLSFVIDSTVRMNRQIRDLATYAAAAVANDLAEPVDAMAAAQTAMNSLSEVIVESQASITIEKLPEVRIQAPALLVLFEQLISNAISFKHPEKSPQIIIDGEAMAGGVHLTVRDNGVGIAPEYHERIFDLFERLSPSTNTATGAGLAICRRIVKAVEGRIWVQSALGEGSTFHLFIPN